MTTWKQPYAFPTLDDKQMAAAREAYIAKHGFKVVIPGFEDVVHVGTIELMTNEEQYHWARKDWSFFTEQRILDLKEMKDRKKKAYLRMLSSPVPEIIRARASLLTSIDNVQDSVSTFTVAMQLVTRVMPRIFGKLIAGPVGWIMTAGDILNLATYVMSPERSSRYVKRVTDSLTENNPFAKKTRLKNAKHLLTGGIKKGAILEVLQVTDSVVGLGISLGGLMNLPFDVFYGYVKHLDGYKVTVELPIDRHNFWQSLAARTTKSINTMFATPGIFTLFPQLPALYASNLCQIIMHGLSFTIDDFFKAAEVEVDIKGKLIKKSLIETYGIEAAGRFLVEAPKPTNILSIEAIKELGHDPNSGVAWPGTGQRFATCNDIFESSHPTATKNFNKFCQDNKNNWEGFIGATAAVTGTYFQYESLGGKGACQYDYTAATKTIHSILNAGYRLPYYLTQPSGWWKKEEDYDYKADVSKKVFDYGPHIANLAAVRPQISPHLRSNWLERMSQSAAVKSEQLAFWQQSQLQADIFPEKPKKQILEQRHAIGLFNPEFDATLDKTLKDELAEVILPKILEYLEDHEKNGSTPTTPNFLDYLYDNYSMILPVNKTAEAPPPIPIIPGPRETP